MLPLIADYDGDAALLTVVIVDIRGVAVVAYLVFPVFGKQIVNQPGRIDVLRLNLLVPLAPEVHHPVISGIA